MKNQQIKGFYEFASFRLDVKQRQVFCRDEPISLTPKEFDVLFLLIENAGNVVEKDELLEKIWKDTFVEEGTLTRNISWLRKKLAACDPNITKIIETLPKREGTPCALEDTPYIDAEYRPFASNDRPSFDC